MKKSRENLMNDQEIIFQQAAVIEKDAECIRQLSDLLKETLTLLTQYQTVEAEERKFEEIMKLSTFDRGER